MGKMVTRLRTLAHSRGFLRRPLLSRAITMGTLQHVLRRDDVVVFVDFDQTITKRDTIGLLFDAARATCKDDQLRAAHTQQVSQLVDQFIHDSKALTASKLSSSPPAHTMDYFDEKGLRDYLKGFAEVDLRSIQRVIASKTLSLMSQSAVEAAADRAEVMNGCVEVLSMPSRVWVLSANWSQTMIRTTMRQVGLSHAQVIANELKMDANGLTTGDIELVMQGPTDKEAFVANATAQHDGAISVYIGDSTNDLLAMLQADVGITLGFAVDSSFVQVCRQFGVQLVPLSAYASTHSCISKASSVKGNDQRIIFTASSWQDIQAIFTQ